jgi:hypothetical protein
MNSLVGVYEGICDLFVILVLVFMCHLLNSQQLTSWYIIGMPKCLNCHNFASGCTALMILNITESSLIISYHVPTFQDVIWAIDCFITDKM